MKHRKIYLKNWLLISCCCFILLGCKDDDSNSGDVRLERCNIGTEFRKDYPLTEILLFRNERSEDIEMGQVYIVFSDTGAHLSFKHERESTLFFGSTVCNFPGEIREWDIPTSGLPVLIEGRIYDYDRPVPGIVGWNYLELTFIKRI